MFQCRKETTLVLRRLSTKRLTKRKTEKSKDEASRLLCGIVQTKKKDKISKSTKTEDNWFTNLDYDTLKLFRKTSSGKYMEVDKDKLIDALKLHSKKTSKEKRQGKFDGGTEQSDKLGQNANVGKASPVRIPQIIVRNMTRVPLLAKGRKSSDEDDVNASEMSVVSYPSVSKILTETMATASRMALIMWRKRMIGELGEDGFSALNRETLRQGTRFHSCLKNYLNTADEREVKLDPGIEGCWKSIEKVLPLVSDVKVLEGHVSHPLLFYKGIVDCVASYKDVPCVIEWKKSDKIKTKIEDVYDAPVQCCAYLGALSRDKKYKFPVRTGLIVVAHTDGTPATVFHLDSVACQKYWKIWVEKVQSYWLTATKLDVSLRESKSL